MTPQQVLAEWLATEADRDVDGDDLVRAADLIASLETEGVYVVTDGEAVVDGSVCRMEPATNMSARSIYHDRAGQVRAAGDHRVLYRWRPRAVSP